MIFHGLQPIAITEFFLFVILVCLPTKVNLSAQCGVSSRNRTGLIVAVFQFSTYKLFFNFNGPQPKSSFARRRPSRIPIASISPRMSTSEGMLTIVINPKCYVLTFLLLSHTHTALFSVCHPLIVQRRKAFHLHRGLLPWCRDVDCRQLCAAYHRYYL